MTLIFLVSAGSELGGQEQDSLDGHLVTSEPAVKTKRSGRSKVNKESSSDSEQERDQQHKVKQQQHHQQQSSQQQQQSKPVLKTVAMERSHQEKSHHSNFSQKSGVSKTSKSSKTPGARPSSNSPAAKKPSLDLNPFSGVLWDRRESFAQLWVSLSAMYGKLLVLLMLAFCLIEVMDNKIRPLYFQNFFMMYLYCGSIIAIMCIYITVLLDNCPSVTNSRENLTHNGAGDPEVGSIGSLGTLRRAHISRNKVSRTSFYLRVGALGKIFKGCCLQSYYVEVVGQTVERLL